MDNWEQYSFAVKIQIYVSKFQTTSYETNPSTSYSSTVLK